MGRIGLGIAAALVFASSAHAAGWSVYTFADQSFSIESPAPLTKGTSTYKGAIAGVIPTITYTAQLDNIRYKVSVIDISNRIPESVNLFEEMEFLTSLGGKVIGNDSVGIEPGKNRHYGRELVINTKDGNFLRITLVYNKGKIYASEAAVLANQMGQVVMVVEAGKTPEAALKAALARIETDNVIGLLLNKGQGAEQRYHYGGYG